MERLYLSPGFQTDELKLGGGYVKINKSKYRPVSTIQVFGEDFEAVGHKYNLQINRNMKWFNVHSGKVTEAQCEPSSLAMVLYQLIDDPSSMYHPLI